jgi:hypothetical protein
MTTEGVLLLLLLALCRDAHVPLAQQHPGSMLDACSALRQLAR